MPSQSLALGLILTAASQLANESANRVVCRASDQFAEKRIRKLTVCVTNSALIQIERIAINLRVFLGFLLGFLKFFFQQAASILMRTHLLSKHLFARLFLLIEILDHVFKRAQ